MANKKKIILISIFDFWFFYQTFLDLLDKVISDLILTYIQDLS
jgi:hypothetical protein